MSSVAKKIRKGDSAIAFLLGLSVCEGISRVFSVGNTSFSFAEVIASLCFVYFCFKRPGEVLSFFKKVPFGFKLFFIAILCSSFSAVIHFSSISVLGRYIAGMVYLAVILTVAIDVYVLRESKRHIFNGLALGLILNMLISVISYISFTRGNVISFETVFPQEGFYTPVQTFRSQGLFLEPSHFVRFVATVVLIIIANKQSKSGIIAKIVFTALLITTVALSTSGTVVILAISVFVFFLLQKTNKKSRMLGVALLIAVALLLAYLFVFGSDISSFEELINKILLGADISSEDNAERYNAMRESVGYLKDTVLGCGWNMVGTLFDYNGSDTVSSFSDLLEMTLELGFVGITIYVLAVANVAVKLFKKKNNYSTALALSLLTVIAIQVGTDYAFNSCIMMLLGLIVSDLSDNSSEPIGVQ